MPTSKYPNVTRNEPTNQWKVQIIIAGKLRFFGYHETEEDAAQAAENARLYLQEFFPKPPHTLRAFDIVAETTYPAIDKVRQQLRAENAPTFVHLPVGAELVPDELRRLFSEVLQAKETLDHKVALLGAAFKRTL